MSDPPIPPELLGGDTRDRVLLARRRALTIELRRQGWSWRRIAAVMGVSQSTARHRARQAVVDDD